MFLWQYVSNFLPCTVFCNRKRSLSFGDEALVLELRLWLAWSHADSQGCWEVILKCNFFLLRELTIVYGCRYAYIIKWLSSFLHYWVKWSSTHRILVVECWVNVMSSFDNFKLVWVKLWMKISLTYFHEWQIRSQFKLWLLLFTFYLVI